MHTEISFYSKYKIKLYAIIGVNQKQYLKLVHHILHSVVICQGFRLGSRITFSSSLLGLSLRI